MKHMSQYYGVIIFCLFQYIANAQIDSSRLEYFPLHPGDLLQYTYGNEWGFTPFFRNQIIANPDTIMSNGLHYVKVINSPYAAITKYFRIDSLMRVQENIYFPTTTYDTSAIINSETAVFRLNEPVGSIWKIAYNIESILTHYPYLFRYNGIFSVYAFGQYRDAMNFEQGVYDPIDKDTTWGGNGCTLLRGFGVFRIDYGENLFLQLTGAVINGKTYGFIQTGVDGNLVAPTSFTLAQNYPNPFNGKTIIKYSISHPTHVTLKIYDMLGREVMTVIDKLSLPGDYVKSVDFSNQTSGMYIYRLSAENQVLTKKMVHLK
jgi:hypothetical protein